MMGSTNTNPDPDEPLEVFCGFLRAEGYSHQTDAMNSPESPDPLSQTLAAWRIRAPRDPGFRAIVRARLSGQAGALPWSVYARQHAAAIGATLALAILVGAAGGYGRARSRIAAESAQLAATYVQALDARTMVMR
jgi:hypothetical protein